MSRLTSDRPLHRLMREFIVALNRLENAEARGADTRLHRDLESVVRHTGSQLESALVDRGWSPPSSLRAVTTEAQVITL